MKQTILIALMLLSTAATVSAKNLDLNLASQSAGVVDRNPVEAGNHLVVIASLIPGKRYRLEINRSVVDIAELSAPEAVVEGEIDVCQQPLDALLGAFESVNEERRVPDGLDQLRERAIQKNCTEAQRNRLERIIDQETTRTHLATLGRGEQLEVIVERAQGQQKLTWSTIFTTGPRGEWRVLYGFNFAPNEDKEFYTLPKEGEMGMFDIVEKTDNEELDFAPSVFFQWLPGKRRNKSWNCGPVAGLGFDFDNPIVFGGFGATYNENVMFTLGAVVHEQSRLAGEFSLDRAIGENLDNDKLTDPTYDLNFYFGVAFRFGSNPFRGRQDDGQQDQ